MEAFLFVFNCYFVDVYGGYFAWGQDWQESSNVKALFDETKVGDFRLI